MPTSVLEEQEPGVYVRNNRPDQELDFLWDRERKKAAEHDRFHLGFFLGGMIVGSFITFAGCALFFTGGKLLPVNAPEKPTVVVEQSVNGPQSKVVETKDKGFKLPFLNLEPSKKADTSTAQTDQPKARVYQIQSGDTLGGIALKFYKSSAPEYVQRIQRANQMTDADSLALGKRLIIPPKSY